MINAQDIDPIEFLEDYLGVKLLMYQKEILRRMLSLSKDTIYIYPWQRYERPNIRMINDDLSDLKGKVNVVLIKKEPKRRVK